jgi:hypothetical protein
MLDQLGKLSIDYTRDASGKAGYLLTAGDGDCSNGCSSC